MEIQEIPFQVISGFGNPEKKRHKTDKSGGVKIFIFNPFPFFAVYGIMDFGKGSL